MSEQKVAENISFGAEYNTEKSPSTQNDNSDCHHYIDKRQKHSTDVNDANTVIKDPSTAVISYYKWKENRESMGRSDKNTKDTVIIRAEKNAIAKPMARNLSAPNMRPLTSGAISEMVVVPNVKQALIRTELTRDEEEHEDDFDAFEEIECQPDWVTSSLRLGSTRRKMSKKGLAMQRIQKEIELEKQRQLEMAKKRQRNYVTPT
ncbi:unnamed protein product [Thelazia callipaeda]|uniref:Bestrophin homolog n=1 Tax=Thelazia callipaeda TaxID=103827 RepID=A0A0N5D7U1_THECL|nr:unnamed protein product [Thelazia callipaeda]